jgi:hypothetical protein
MAAQEKDRAEVLHRWTPWDSMRIKPREQIWKQPGLPHQVFAAMTLMFWLIFAPMNAVGLGTEDGPQTPLPPGVGVQVKALPETATVGDPVRIDVEITVPAGYRVKITEPEPKTGDFTILDFFPGPTVPGSQTPQDVKQSGKLQPYRARIVTAVYRTGKFTFPPFPIKLQAPDGKEIALSSPPLDIEIKSVLDDKSPKLKDLKKQAEIREPVRWLLWAFIALAACLLGAVFLYYLKKRRRHPVSYSPEQIRDLLEIAEADLRKLLSRGLPSDGMAKEFYVLLSEIVKRILEAGYEIHTAEQTTSEIMGSLVGRSDLEPEKLNRIESFFVRCDAVKFAKYVPPTVEHETAAKDALEILAQVKKAGASRQLPVASEQWI